MNTEYAPERVVLRMPVDLRREVEHRAKRNRRSMPGEVLMMLEAAIAAEKTASEHTA